jgi:hypothetical protein
MSASAFAARAWIATIAFAASIFAFPYMMSAIVRSSGCAGIGGACGAVGLVAAVEIKPIFFYGYVAFLIGVSVPRSRDLGLPWICGLFLPLMVLADSNFGLLAGAGWAAAFVAGVLQGEFPYFLVFALALILFQSIAPSNSLCPRDRPLFRTLRALAFSIGLILSILALWRCSPLWVLFSIGGARLNAIASVVRYSIWLTIPLLCILTVLSWTGWRSPAPEPAAGSASRERHDLGWSFGRAIALAAMVSFVIAVFDTAMSGGGVSPVLIVISLPGRFAWMLVPTFLLYLAPICAVMHARARRSMASAALLAASSVPFVFWILAEARTYQDKQDEIGVIADIPKASIGHVPTTIVFSGEPVFCARIRSKVPEISEVIQVSYGPRYEKEDCAGAKSSGVKREKIDRIPDEYIRFLGGRDSQFSKQGHVKSALGQSLELRYIAPGRDDLIAVSYETYNPYPLAPPALTTSGWLRPTNTARSEDVLERVQNFVTDALVSQRTPAENR